VTEGQQLRYCGVGHDYERVIIKGDVDDLKVGWHPCHTSRNILNKIHQFIAYYIKKDKIIAVAS
jgi:apoptosis-inducing factor 3